LLLVDRCPFKRFLALFSLFQKCKSLAEGALNWSNIPVVPVAIALVLGAALRHCKKKLWFGWLASKMGTASRRQRLSIHLFPID